MSQHLEVLVNKDFEKLLVGFDIVQINDAFGVTESDNILRKISKSKNPEVKKLFKSLCDTIMDAIIPYIKGYGAIIKAEINYSIADYLNKQLGNDTYAHYDIRELIVDTTYFQKLLKEKGIKKSKIAKFREFVKDLGMDYLDKRSIYYKTEQGAKEYLQKLKNRISQ